MKYISGLLNKKISNWIGKEWYHQRFDGSPYFIHFIAEAEVATHTDRKEGGYFVVHYCFFENGKADWYIEMEDIKRVTRAMIEGGKGDIKFIENLIASWKKDEELFYDWCKKIEKTDLSRLDDRELLKLHDDFVQVVLNRNSSSSIIDGFALGSDQILADKLKTVYELSDIRHQMRFSEFFSTLTAPIHISFINEAEIALLTVAETVKVNPVRKKVLLERHQKNYFWTRNNYVDANILSVEYFDAELEAIFRNHKDISGDINKIKNTPIEHKKNKDALLKKVKIDKDTLYLIHATEHFTHWQDERKKATFFAIHYGSLLLEEVSKRTGIPCEDLKYGSPREIDSIFSSPGQYRSILKERTKNSVFYWDTEGHESLYGKEADVVKEKILGTVDISHIKDFRGLTASIGKVSGTAKVVKSVKDISKVLEGDILVAVMTRPDYVPAMKKAAAIVTDEGGITCHAAIVSRELGKPCIIGTKIATKVITDGMQVEVNANHGVVKLI